MLNFNRILTISNVPTTVAIMAGGAWRIGFGVSTSHYSDGSLPMRMRTVALASTLALAAGAADATTTTSTFTVQMTITSSCVINSASTLNFGSSGVISANVDQTSTVQV